MSELKKMCGLKSLKVKTAFVAESGYKQNGDFQSNSPHAVTPATPVQTAVTVAKELGHMAEIYHNSGAEVALGAVEAAVRNWDWKGREGYERGESPAKQVLTKLAEGQGYHLVPFFEGNGFVRFQDAFQRDAEESNYQSDYKATWERTWKSICTNEDGTFNLDAIQRELSDYSVLIHFYSTVLEHVTGGRVSKLFTWPSVVNSVVDERVNELVNDMTEDLELQLKADETHREQSDDKE